MLLPGGDYDDDDDCDGDGNIYDEYCDGDYARGVTLSIYYDIPGLLNIFNICLNYDIPGREATKNIFPLEDLYVVL